MHPSSVADPRRPGRLAGWVVFAAALGAVIVWPLTRLFSVAVEEISTIGTSALDRATAGGAVFNSLWVSLMVATVSVATGVAAAYVTERSGASGRRWMRAAILLPLLVPGFVSALSWMRAYGPSGLTAGHLGLGWNGLQGPGGVVVVIAVNAMPISYLMAAAAFNSSVARDVERAARVSGATRSKAMTSMTLPLMTPVLLGAGILSFVVSLNSFGVPAILGTPARFSTVTTRIYQDLARSARPESFTRAVVLACGLAVAAFILTALAESVMGRAGTGPRTAEPSGPVTPPGRWRGLSAVLVWVVVVVVTVIPLLALVSVAITRAVGLDPVPENWTLAHFEAALDGRFRAALLRSLLLSSAAAVVGVSVGMAAASVRGRRSGRAVGGVVLLAFAVPGSTLAVAVLLAYGRSLRDTLLLILIAYVAKLWAVGHRSVQGAIRTMSPEVMWAARAAGASALAAGRTIKLPLLRPALVAGFALIFLFALHELTMSSLLYGPGTDTLAVAILNLQQIGDVPVSSALAVILTVPLIILAFPLLASRRLSQRLLRSE